MSTVGSGGSSMACHSGCGLMSCGASVCVVLPGNCSASAYQLRVRGRLLLLVLCAQPARVRLGLGEAILGLGMGSLLPHLMRSVSRAVEQQVRQRKSSDPSRPRRDGGAGTAMSREFEDSWRASMCALAQWGPSLCSDARETLEKSPPCRDSASAPSLPSLRCHDRVQLCTQPLTYPHWH